MSYDILVVSSDDLGSQRLKAVLTNAGYHARAASTFEDAKRLLASKMPDLLITDERLNEFNGVHLVLRGRAVNPQMSAIVTSPKRDAVLERDVAAFRAQYVVKPCDPAELLEYVSRALEHEEHCAPYARSDRPMH